jgi:calcineurin-like phosphoesterase family protein
MQNLPPQAVMSNVQSVIRVSDVVECVGDFIIHLEKTLASLIDDIAWWPSASARPCS